jgi:dienelactone hydrolase
LSLTVASAVHQIGDGGDAWRRPVWTGAASGLLDTDATNGILRAMSLLESWAVGDHRASGVRHPTYRKGAGPGVVVIHEIPGLTPAVVGFGEELVEAGYTVVMPHLFGEPGTRMTPVTVAGSLRQVCVSREFTKLATRQTSPVAGWLRSLARDLHAELGGPGVGALGMCFTGGFALAMMVDDAVAAPVLAQPSTPFAVSRSRSRDLNLSDADLAKVKERAAAGCEVLGLRYLKDPTVGKRFARLTEEIGEAFIRVELPGKGHSTVTEQRSQVAVDAVLEFFAGRLKTS